MQPTRKLKVPNPSKGFPCPEGEPRVCFPGSIVKVYGVCAWVPDSGDYLDRLRGDLDLDRRSAPQDFHYFMTSEKAEECMRVLNQTRDKSEVTRYEVEPFEAVLTFDGTFRVFTTTTAYVRLGLAEDRLLTAREKVVKSGLTVEDLDVLGFQAKGTWAIDNIPVASETETD